MPCSPEWLAPGAEPMDVDASRLPVTNLALRRRRTVAFEDVVAAPELDDPSLGGRDVLVHLGSRAVLATPIVVFDRVIGGFTLHRAPSRGAGLTATSRSPSRSPARSASRFTRLGCCATTSAGSACRRRSSRRRRWSRRTFGSSRSSGGWSTRSRASSRRTRPTAGSSSRGRTRSAAARSSDCPRTRSSTAESLPPDLQAEAIETGRPVLVPRVRAHRAAGAEQELRAVRRGHGRPDDVARRGAGDPRRLLARVGRFDSSELEFSMRSPASRRSRRTTRRASRSASARPRSSRASTGSPRRSARRSPCRRPSTLAQAAAEALGGEAALVVEPTAADSGSPARTRSPTALADRLSTGLAAATRRPFLRAARRSGSSRPRSSRTTTASTRRPAGFSAARTRRSSRPRSSGAARTSPWSSSSGRRTSFADDDLALARHLSRAARGALDRSELFEAERRARSLSERLATLGGRLVTSLAPRHVLDEAGARPPSSSAPTLRPCGSSRGRSSSSAPRREPERRGLQGSHAGSGAGLLGDVVQSRRAAGAEDIRADRSSAAAIRSFPSRWRRPRRRR